ncbi:MAG: hypothetical protein AAF986_10315, partial [Pseudomonadota bacterium]
TILQRNNSKATEALLKNSFSSPPEGAEAFGRKRGSDRNIGVAIGWGFLLLIFFIVKALLAVIS